MLVPDESQRESEDSSETQSEIRLEGEKKAVKTKFTEGIFWRSFMPTPKPTVKRKAGQKLKNKKLGVPNAKKCEIKEILMSENKNLTDKSRTTEPKEVSKWASDQAGPKLKRT